MRLRRATGVAVFLLIANVPADGLLGAQRAGSGEGMKPQLHRLLSPEQVA